MMAGRARKVLWKGGAGSSPPLSDAPLTARCRPAQQLRLCVAAASVAAATGIVAGAGIAAGAGIVSVACITANGGTGIVGLQAGERLQAGTVDERTGTDAALSLLELRGEENVYVLDVRHAELIPLVGGLAGDAELKGAEAGELHTVAGLQRARHLGDKGLDDGEHVRLVDGALLLYALGEVVGGVGVYHGGTAVPLALGRAALPVALINLVVDCHNCWIASPVFSMALPLRRQRCLSWFPSVFYED